MSTTRTINDAASPVFPKATSLTSIGTAGAVRAITFTSGQVNEYYSFWGTQTWNPRADATASATAGDLPHAAIMQYVYKITPDRLRVSVYMATAGTLYWARTSP